METVKWGTSYEPENFQTMPLSRELFCSNKQEIHVFPPIDFLFPFSILTVRAQ